MRAEIGVFGEDVRPFVAGEAYVRPDVGAECGRSPGTKGLTDLPESVGVCVGVEGAAPLNDGA